MGSRNSKLNPEGEAVPAKLRPLVRRWFDEIRRRKSPNISKKELLINDGVEEDGSNSQPLSVQDNERKSSTSSSDESVASSSKVEDEKSNVQVPVPAEDSEKTSKEAKENKDEKKCDKQDEKDGTGQKEEKEVKVVEKAVVVEEVFVLARETVEDDDEEEEEGNEDEKVTFGSPSFRVYCIPSTENSKEESKYLQSSTMDPIYICIMNLGRQHKRLLKLMHAGKDESMHRNSGSGESVESNSDEVHIYIYITHKRAHIITELQSKIRKKNDIFL